MKMKKMLFGALLGMFTLAGVAVLPNVASAQDSVKSGQLEGDDKWNALFDSDGGVSTDNKLTGQKSAGATGLTAVKRAINMVLALLATIAVIICMYAGFLMVTAAGDENKYKKGLNVLKYAAIGLAIIGLAWIIVSLVMWFVNSAAGGKGNITS